MHNLFTFVQELVVLYLNDFLHPQVALLEIPEAQRNPTSPIRFKIGLKNPPQFPSNG